MFSIERTVLETTMYSREAIWSRVYFFLTGGSGCLFDVVAHHGRGELYPAKGAEAGVDILHGLVQIQPYGREVAVPGQGKPGGAGRNAALGFIVHSGSCFLFSG